MSGPDPIFAAIAAHLAAYDAYQVAEEGEASVLAHAAYRDENDALVATACTTAGGAVALLTHLRWWIAEEAEFSEDYGLAYRAAQMRVADLTALACACWPASAVGPNPIHRAIAATDAAEARGALVWLLRHEMARAEKLGFQRSTMWLSREQTNAICAALVAVA